jgi:hypothetical protein
LNRLRVFRRGGRVRHPSPPDYQKVSYRPSIEPVTIRPMGMC